jgi:hypothetical protein
VLLAGCSGKGGGEYEVNEAPDTQISFGPVENSQTYFKVQCFWFGTDMDGTVEGYQVAKIADISLDSLGRVEFDALPFVTTAATESTFVLEADSCCDSQSSGQIATSYWGILVRAVDNEGAVDPTPERRFFQTANVVPRVRMTIPPKSATPLIGMPSNPYVEWRGEDSDGDVGSMQYKFIISPVLKEYYSAPYYPLPPLPPFDHVYTGAKAPHAVTPVGYWSDWVPADCTYVRDVNLAQFATGEGLLYFPRLCVTCKDEGGAVLPEALFGELYNGNVNWVMISVIPQGAGVPAVIDAGPLGRRTSDAVAYYTSTVAGLFVGTEVSFRFWGKEALDRGLQAKEFRYYFDDPEDPRTSAWNYWTSTEPIRDKANNPQWIVRYPPDGTIVPTLGPHIFTVELRDLNKDVTHCEFRMEVLNGPVGKPDKLVYLVDDDVAEWLSPGYQYYERDSDALWAEILEPYNCEVFDTGTKYTREVSVRRIADASTVIWNVDQDDVRPTCQLTTVCYEKGNYLDSYVKVGGNLIIIGRDPIYACQFWPNQTPPVDMRGDRLSLDFTPVFDQADSTYMYNFNWDIFGIVKMDIAAPDVPTNELHPCEPGFEPIHSEWFDGMLEGWDGTLYNPFYITRLRTDEDMGVPIKRIYTTVPVDELGNQLEPDCEARWIGVYVPAHGERGHAAYIGIPPWFFNHDRVKVLIQKLLDEFGEPRKTF